MDSNPFTKGRGLKPPRFTDNANGGNRDVFNAVAVGEPRDAKKTEQLRKPIPVELPSHIYPYAPLGSQPLDFRKLCNVTAGSSNLAFMSFTAPQGSRTVFQAYAIFSDALNANLTNFVPTVDGQRVFPYHGDPTDNFRIALGLAPDISNNALIPSQLILEPGQKMTWFVSNTDTVDVAMGVRMVGYFDVSAPRVTPRFGG